jgi:hypothetical protein
MHPLYGLRPGRMLSPVQLRERTCPAVMHRYLLHHGLLRTA